MSVLIVTSLGDIVLDLHTDRCPLTCKNFLKLCKIKYYNGCLFHTVQKDFTAQTGDPTGTGSGGDSIYKFLYGDQARFFGDEIRLDLKHSKTGTVAMASGGENLNASQFYITLRDDLDYLDGKHTVAEGLETLSRINEAYVDEKSRPYKNIRIKHTYILDDPFEDPTQLTELIPDASPEGKPKDEVDDEVRLEDDWVPMDEQLGAGELEEVIRAKEAHSRAVVLESIGDIPDAEIKPPDNVLFVCKLNPVTEDEDLHTIFSRFGTVSSSEIIRDYKTGDSLCYAFIEFDDKESCEQAYFKMDNALIDDRRIHVDFSQSVSKLWNQYRRKGNKAGKGGKGCFKCGSLDHIAKDCTGSPDAANPPPKYTLKDDGFSRKRGDDGSREIDLPKQIGLLAILSRIDPNVTTSAISRYDMVFDEDTHVSPERKKQPKHREMDTHQEQRKVSHRATDETKQDDYRHKDLVDERNDRRKEHRRDDRHHTSGGRKYYERDKFDHRTRRNDDSRHRGRSNDKREDSRDEGYSRKRYREDENDGGKVGDKNGRRDDRERDEAYRRKIRVDDVERTRSKGEDLDRVKSSTRYDERDRK